MNSLTITDIAKILKTRPISASPLKGNAKVSNFLFDSRSLIDAEGTIFCALNTKAADGHKYIAPLYNKGVRLFLVSKLPDDIGSMSDAYFIVVKDVMEAVENLAYAWRSNLKNVVAITGSAGKTVVKEMIFNALASNDIKASRSPRSWNSRIGAPFSLLEASPTDDAVIIETGIDSPGDMKHHAEIIRPQIGILTAITSEHDAGFDSKEAKIREKIKLFKYAGIIIFDASDPLVNKIISEEYPDRQLIPIKADSPMKVDCLIAKETIRQLGYSFDVEPAMTANRIDVHKGLNDSTVLFDAFTHDLRSVEFALDFLKRRSGEKKSSAILSDLFHRPSENLTKIYHKLGQALLASNIQRLIAIGPELRQYRHLLPPAIEVVNLENADDFITDFDISRFPSETVLISGQPLSKFHEIMASLESPRHDTVLEVNLDAIVHNFNYFRSLLPQNVGMIAMIKASAYGVGAPEVAKTLQAQGASYLAVAVIDEGIELRRAGITMPIMVLNPVTTNYRALFRHNLEPSIFSLRELNILVDEARKAGVEKFNAHIKLDTGMHRVGFTENELPRLKARLKEIPEINVSSIFSHLATADCPDQKEYTKYQLDTFDKMSSYFPVTTKRHILNTAGIMTHPERHADFVRLGIGLYGISPLEKDTDIRPVASLKTTIISLKEWEEGTTIGYGRRGKLERPSVIATLPIGYADGIDRHLGCGNASFLVKGVECPTVGNICMDQCMIDVTDVEGVQIGDQVEIFGAAMPIEKLAETLGTISYEVLTSVSPRVRRIYFRD